MTDNVGILIFSRYCNLGIVTQIVLSLEIVVTSQNNISSYSFFDELSAWFSIPIRRTSIENTKACFLKIIKRR